MSARQGPLIIIVLSALALVACGRSSPPGQSAAAPADLPPSTGHIIGPVPGPGDRSPGMSNPFTGDARAASEGRRLFEQFNCAGCHGTHAGGGMGPSLRDAAWIYGNEDADVYDSVASGRAHGMPAFGTLLPAQGIWRLVAYVQALGTSDEPQPPK